MFSSTKGFLYIKKTQVKQAGIVSQVVTNYNKIRLSYTITGLQLIKTPGHLVIFVLHLLNHVLDLFISHLIQFDLFVDDEIWLIIALV